MREESSVVELVFKSYLYDLNLDIQICKFK